MSEPFAGDSVDIVVGIESRGFLLAGSIAERLGSGVGLVRKPGKLPRETVSVTYDLEYGTDTLEVHQDAFAKGAKVLIVDDVLATGGTLAAASELIFKAGGDTVGAAMLLELSAHVLKPLASLAPDDGSVAALPDGQRTTDQNPRCAL
jgi:adenine phosphoribosyltransferase